MRISPQDLQTQYARACRDWSFITAVNNQHRFPPCLLHAVASRETNMTNERGDGGHGHGMFQLDDRWHIIPSGFDQDVRTQTDTAANMLTTLFTRYGDWVQACNAYNSGSPLTSATAGGDYGPDVMARQACLAGITPSPEPPGPGPASIPTMNYGEHSQNVQHLQEFMTAMFSAYNVYTPTGYYGDATAAGLREFQRRTGITGPDADGKTVGPRTKTQLWSLGYRP